MATDIEVGKIVSTHGLAGYLKVYPYINEITDFEFYKSIIIDNKGFKISQVKYKKNTVLLKLREFNHINEVQHLIGKEIFVQKSQLLDSLAEDEYLLTDLIGLKVYNQDGELLGEVSDMRQTSSQTTLIINGEKGEWFLPFVDAFVETVDLEKGLTVKLIEGLIDEN